MMGLHPLQGMYKDTLPFAIYVPRLRCNGTLDLTPGPERMSH